LSSRAPAFYFKKKNLTKAQRDLNPGSREEKNETLLQEQDYQLIASVTKKTSTEFNQTQLHESSKGSPNKNQCKWQTHCLLVITVLKYHSPSKRRHLYAPSIIASFGHRTSRYGVPLASMTTKTQL